MINTKRMVDQFVEMAKIASPSQKEAKYAAYLKQELQELGFEVYIDNAGNCIGGDTGNIIATLRGDKEAEPIMFCCHMDTVLPCENINPIVEGDIIKSDGTTILSGDDKGGIAAILEAIRIVKEQNIAHGTIQAVFTICEESGMHGAKNLDLSKIIAKQAFILDCGGAIGKVINQGPAKDAVKATIYGKTAHAGLCPEKGISAIQIAAQAIADMKLLRIDADTTANIGSIHGGGATNIVPDKVEVIAEARSLSNEKLDAQSAHMKECFQKAAAKLGGRAEVDIQRSYPAYSLDSEAVAVKMAAKAFASMGIKMELVSTGGGSDCNIFNGKGITALDLAIGMTDVHSTDEYIKISDMEKSAQVVVELIKHA